MITPDNSLYLIAYWTIGRVVFGIAWLIIQCISLVVIIYKTTERIYLKKTKVPEVTSDLSVTYVEVKRRHFSRVLKNNKAASN